VDFIFIFFIFFEITVKVKIFYINPFFQKQHYVQFYTQNCLYTIEVDITTAVIHSQLCIVYQEYCVSKIHTIAYQKKLQNK